MHLRRVVRGLDELALEVGFIALAALLGIAVLYLAFNSGTSQRLSAIPIVGPLVSGIRTVVNLVVNR